MKSLIKRLLREELTMKKFDFSSFIDNSEKSIKEIQSCKEMYDCIMGMTMGFHFPFNPPEPLRSHFKNKLNKLKEKFPKEFNKTPYLKTAYNITSGDFIKTPELPKGAMY